MKLPGARFCAAKRPHWPLAGCEGLEMGWILTRLHGVMVDADGMMGMPLEGEGLPLRS